MNKFLFILLFIFSSSALSAQLNTIEQLVKEADQLKLDGAHPGNILAYYLRSYEKSHSISQKNFHNEIGIEIGDLYLSENLPEQALNYYLDGVDQKESLEDNTDINHYRKIAMAYGKLGKVDSSAYFFEKIITKYKRDRELIKESNAISELIQILIDNDQYESAIEKNLELKKLLENQHVSTKEISIINNNLGYCYSQVNEHSIAIDYFNLALPFLQNEDDEKLLELNLGISLFNVGKYDESIQHLLRVEKSNSDIKSSGEIDLLLSNVYLQKRDYQNAIHHRKKAEKASLQTNNSKLLSDTYFTGAQIHAKLFEYDNALDYYQKYFKIRDSILLDEKVRQQQLMQQQQLIERTEKEVKLLLASQELQELTIKQLELEGQKQKLELDNLKLDADRKESELEILRSQQAIQDATLENQALEAVRNKQELEITKQQLARTENESKLADLEQNEKLQELDIQRKDAALGEAQSKRDILEKDQEINALEIQRRKEAQRNLGIGLALLASLLITLYFFYRNKNKDHKKLTLSYSDLEVAQGHLKSAQDRIKSLLSQQVSGAVADELLASKGEQKVERRFVCIMFLDIRDYTNFAENKTPEEIISYQNKVFSFMLNTVHEYGGIVNQILGDGFMATFGAPISTSNDCDRAYRAARKILEDLKIKNQQGEIPKTNIGIGLHAGNVVAGNVGTKKRKQYSITGNTVILASRLEQLNKKFNSNLVFSKEVYDQLPLEGKKEFKFREVNVKGRSKPISVASIKV